MEKRTCNYCNRELTLSDFYTNGPKNHSHTCIECSRFLKNSKNYKDRMSPEDYEKWFNENNPKVLVAKKKKKAKDITTTYMYRNLKRFGNCYVRKINNDVIKDLEFALNVKLKYNETRDNIGYVIEVVK